jgi:hypothetical protein
LLSSFRPLGFFLGGDAQTDASLRQHPFHFVEKIVDQRRRILEYAGSSWVPVGPMPVIVACATPLESTASRLHVMCVVESNQTLSR